MYTIHSIMYIYHMYSFSSFMCLRGVDIMQHPCVVEASAEDVVLGCPRQLLTGTNVEFVFVWAVTFFYSLKLQQPYNDGFTLSVQTVEAEVWIGHLPGYIV